MEFITESGKVICVRISQDSDRGEDLRKIITSFDADVDRVAPHVAARLTDEEINSLKLWLKDRSRLQENLEKKPIESTILETLPSVIIQASEVIKSLSEMDLITYNDIKESIDILLNSLDIIETSVIEPKIKLDEMKSSEELKERLDVIKDNLGGSEIE